MKRPAASPLFKPLSAGLAALAIGASLLAFALTEHQRLRDATAARQIARDGLRSRLASLESSEGEIRRLAGRYAALRERGAVLPPPGPAREPALPALTADHAVTATASEVGRPRRLPASPPGLPALALRSVRLQLAAPHEEILLDLLEDIRRRNDLLLTPRGCRLTRRPPATSDRTALHAECEFDWLHLVTAEDGQP